MLSDFLTEKTGSYKGGILYLVASGVAGGVLVLALPTGKKKKVLNVVTMKKRVEDSR